MLQSRVAGGVGDVASRISHRAVQMVSVVVRNLYWAPPAGNAAAATPADIMVLRSAVYQRLRPSIVSYQLVTPVIVTIKVLHTAIFAVLMSFVVFVTSSFARDRPTRRTLFALLAVALEGFVLTVNQGRCPLTVVVEDLGAEHGSVSDICLPSWVARHITHISSALLGLGMLTLVLRRFALHGASPRDPSAIREPHQEPRSLAMRRKKDSVSG